MSELAPGSALKPFGDVRENRNRRASHLILQRSVAQEHGIPGESIHSVRYFSRLAINVKILKLLGARADSP
jgi:hypothetical protein